MWEGAGGCWQIAEYVLHVTAWASYPYFPKKKKKKKKSHFVSIWVRQRQKKQNKEVWGSDRCDPGGRWQVRSWWAGWMRVRGERNKLGRRRLTWRSSSQQFQWLILTLLEKKRVRAHTHTHTQGGRVCVLCFYPDFLKLRTFETWQYILMMSNGDKWSQGESNKCQYWSFNTDWLPGEGHPEVLDHHVQHRARTKEEMTK